MPHSLRSGERYTGQQGLVERLGPSVPRPLTVSILGPGRRQTHVDPALTVERYPPNYDRGSGFIGDLKFTFRNEPLDLLILSAAFAACDPQEIRRWVEDEPTGKFSRQAWFFYELLTDRRLDLPDAGAVISVPALDPRRHVVAGGVISSRHRVIDNLLGTAALCPIIRRTRKLDTMMQVDIDAEVASVVAHTDPDILARAVNYFYTKETRSSYAIEGEQVSLSRAERFVAALRAVKDFDLDAQSNYVDLQNRIVDPRYAADGWRPVQNFVGETGAGFQEIVHSVFPKPADVDDLMAGLGALGRRLIAGDIDAVLAAAAISFAFVFIHPFEDGNGRIHRFLIHHVLARKGLTPPGMIFPVSAPIVRDQSAYDVALETFSRRIMRLIDWRWRDGEVIVENDTARLYRYFDATAVAEFLYEKVIETIRVDLREEIAFLSVFHRARRAVMELVDMPDRRADLFIRLCMQNEGRLSAAKRKIFAELSDREVAALEVAVAEAREAQDDGRQLTLDGFR